MSTTHAILIALVWAGASVALGLLIGRWLRGNHNDADSDDYVRAYAITTGMPFNIDADLANADWAKRTWDIYTPDHTLVTTLDQLRQALPQQSDADLKAMLTLPVAQGMPQPLKRQLQAL